MKLAIKIILPLVVLAAGFGTCNYLIKTKPQAARKPAGERATLVKAEAAKLESVRVKVRAMGTVVPARTVVVMPEVTGRVLEHHPALVPGGRIKAGEELVRIDDRDYKLAARQQAANVAHAKTEIKVEKGRKKIAEREWKLLGSDVKANAEGKALALREPYLQSARASLKSAQSAVRRARLAASKTVITAPFNGIVQAESVEQGQLVSMGSQLVTLVGSDLFWVEVSVPVDKLTTMKIPGVSTADELGSVATVTHDAGSGMKIERQGHVVRLLSGLDQLGKMARVVVAVPNPLGLKPDGTTDGLPLMLGAYVEVAIEAGSVDEVVRLPRVALRDGAKVWLVGAESRLEERPVSIHWRLADEVLVRGLAKGDMIVLSRIGTPVPRMKLEVDTAGDADKPKPRTAEGSP